MPYQKLVQRAQPALIQMILDDSASMKIEMPGTSKTRYELVEQHAGVLLTELIARSTHFEANGPVVRPRYFLDVIKYGSRVEHWSASELDIDAASRQFDAENGSFGLGGKLEGTDAAKAFQSAYDRLQVMLNHSRYKDSFPPMVFHLTDGESQSDASELARPQDAFRVGKRSGYADRAGEWSGDRARDDRHQRQSHSGGRREYLSAVGGQGRRWHGTERLPRLHRRRHRSRPDPYTGTPVSTQDRWGGTVFQPRL